ncbi:MULTISPECIES: class I SAM-dependent methyltransferase [Streptomyces]|uniref:SAM-dependent methyltransferase n=1 Tax=Streptomyces diastaticus subsp. diastaticus TaxID=68040 RepID=A0ABQ1CM06_STRDI|nr:MULTISPECIES: class I SAM-dependent methyltransferase [Streptomyces]PJM85677.1 methyltransferase [Streptomyces sp. TSRI0384-2]WSU38101.1 methyltransferase domain-containing protein [Streptomyces gougerotii]GFH71310.1 SAM-dependent methyltransferase [Streptomyces diastaticus subsp. diastaticus]GGU11583.1 SAM-dependent methyltransferase [Streptomyces diastaticus subsp. diastaticus]
MTSTDARSGPPRPRALTFHGPLGEPRAADLTTRLAAHRPATVLDIGCGWGELMLRVLAAVPGATGTGLDLDEDDLARGRALAAERGLADRVEFLAGQAAGTEHGPAELVLCLGASQALTDAAPPLLVPEALRELRRLVRPGGRVLLGEGFWQRTPSSGELARMWPDATASDHPGLPELVDEVVAAGFRPARIETATPAEWEEFESGYREDVEVWLAGHPEHPLAAETRARVDRQRDSWLRGYRDLLGMAYLTLVPQD